MTDFIKELRQAVGIVDVVGEYVTLKKQGTNYVGLCPFHSERSPSFSVSESRGAFYCFGCQKGGDVISFVQEMQGLSFPETIRLLAQKAQMQVPASFAGTGKPGSFQTAGNDKELELIHKLNRFVAQFYKEQLFQDSNKRALDYFKSRGLFDETINDNYLGYAPAEWGALTEFLMKKKAPLELAEKIGLIRKKEKDLDGRSHFDQFRDRVIFPIIDRRGNVVGFGGRLMGGEGPKYLNSSDSPVFSKGEQFYGIFKAQKHIREKDLCVVVEGYMDCLALHQAGMGYTVATLGTSLTETHVKRMSRLTQNIVMLFDGDAAGQAAQVKAMELYLKQGLVVKGISLPEKLDPDEFILKYGSDALEKLILSAPYILDRQILEIKTRTGASSEDRARALEIILPWISMLSSGTSQMVRVQDLSQHFSIPFAALERRIADIKKGAMPVGVPQAQGRIQPKQAVKTTVSSTLDKNEFRFLELLVAKAQEGNSGLGVKDLVSTFKDSAIKQISSLIFNALDAGKSVDVSLLDEVQSAELRLILSRVLAGTSALPGPGEWEDLIRHLKKRRVEHERDLLKEQIKKADALGQGEEVIKLMQEFSSLQKQLDRENELKELP